MGLTQFLSAELKHFLIHEELYDKLSPIALVRQTTNFYGSVSVADAVNLMMIVET